MEKLNINRRAKYELYSYKSACLQFIIFLEILHQGMNGGDYLHQLALLPGIEQPLF